MLWSTYQMFVVDGWSDCVNGMGREVVEEMGWIPSTDEGGPEADGEPDKCEIQKDR